VIGEGVEGEGSGPEKSCHTRMPTGRKEKSTEGLKSTMGKGVISVTLGV